MNLKTRFTVTKCATITKPQSRVFIAALYAKKSIRKDNKMACDKCDKKNTNKGLECKLGYKHSPKTKEATVNMLKNNGFAAICHHNPWKYDL